MAGPHLPEQPALKPLSTTSHDTALCIIPPRHLWSAVDSLRELYDNAYGKWPPHVNLVYPFVHGESLERATESIGRGLEAWNQQQGQQGLKPLVKLDSADFFAHRRGGTIFLCDSDEARTASLQSLGRHALAALGQEARQQTLHLTVAQSDDVDDGRHNFLLRKVGLLPALQWTVDKLHILVRERAKVDGATSSVMKVWGTVDLDSGALSRRPQPEDLYESASLAGPPSDGDDKKGDALLSRSPFVFDEDLRQWRRPLDHSPASQRAMPRALAFSSYNVLAEFAYPPDERRHPLIVANILSKQAAADVVVLQEVTDDFLNYLLADPLVRAAYPFTSHGPPGQEDIEPLPSLLNMVVLSRWAFEWVRVPLRRPHKAAVVAWLRDVGRWEDGEFMPAVVAAVHLTHGLTDGAVASKKTELHRVMKYVSERFPGHAQVLLGDFNITTSRASINAALQKGNITAQTASHLASLDDVLADAGWVDAWQAVSSRHAEDGRRPGCEEEGQGEGEHERLQGEQGATFDPIANALASKMVGSGGNRPQRYDRILVRGEHVLDICRFNLFGVAEGDADAPASDHWGVRCTLKTLGMDSAETADTVADEVSALVVPVELKRTAATMGDEQSLRDVLSSVGALPSQQDAVAREAAVHLLKTIVLGRPDGADAGIEESSPNHPGRLDSRLIFTPVGSYGLGVWTSASDVDVLCIGPYSSPTFFALAVQRIRKAAGQGVRLVRRVRASTGTMLELMVLGIKTDLQYCAATAVAERWPAVLDLPPSDPVFSLPAHTLGKLKAARDLHYLRCSAVPNLATFRLAHRAVKAWAKARGVYSARFGYLGGIHISLLLARVCKLLLLAGPSSGSAAASASGPLSVTVADILTTFFAHYAAFDWRSEIAFDPFFHSKKLRYSRTAREPLAILGYFPPALNTCHAASVPSANTIAKELRRADGLLSREGMSWPEFFASCGSGAAEFLSGHQTFVRIDFSYWGISSSRGARFVGWLESRCPAILVDISHRVPGAHARMWPARFVDAVPAPASSSPTAGAEEGGGGQDHQGCYLIGLEQQAPDGQAAERSSKEDQRAARGALLAVLRRFQDLIRGNEKYFDARCQWMSTAVLRRSELGELVLDSREWGRYAAGDDEEDDEDEDEDDGVGSADDGDDPLDAENIGPPASAAKAKKPKMGKDGKRARAHAGLQPPGSRAKLRAAADVMNRLRWDPSFDSGDFIVGYEDRFTGAREKALNLWKTDLTDEEFIPQHRILYFKRESDGATVWERHTRKDELFGSGGAV